MTQLTKLGDVAAYLRAGDSLKWGSLRLSVASELDDGAVGVVGIRLSGDASRLNVAHDVELLNPRWVPYYGDNAPARVEQQCLLLSRGEPLTVAEFYERNINDAGAHILCRETAGKLEPVRAGELPREVKVSELLPGDSVRPREDSEPLTVKAFDGAGCALLYPYGFLWPDAFVTLLSRNNPIPGDTPQPDSLPRLVKGSELRVGDEALFPKGKLEMRTVSSIDARGWVHFACGSCIGPEAVVELLSRAEPASQPQAPALDTDRLRREWEYLAERTPWDAMAGIYESRQWECSPFVQDTVPLSWELRLAADDLFYRALKDPRLVAEGARMLVVLQPDNRDRPIELFAEALNAVAYHAKVEELWPTAATEAEAPKNCVTCDAMCASGQIECGDCRSGRARRFSNLPPSFTRTENRFRGLPPAPGVRLSPGARYHLADDADAFGIPEHN